jgi:hypothetical protein
MLAQIESPATTNAELNGIGLTDADTTAVAATVPEKLALTAPVNEPE